VNVFAATTIAGRASGRISGRKDETMTNHPNRKKTDEKAVLVTTAHRGVFFGYATDVTGSTIKLRSARNCISWSSDMKGFLGLANPGPSKSCKIGPAANIELRDITCVAECTPEAVAAWEAAPWK
jgi:hypothetical protein